MPSDDNDAGVIDFYRRNASAWVRDRESASPFAERTWLDRFRSLIPEGGTILDLGCGSGDPIASHLIRAGYAVTGVDAAPEMVDIFRERQPSAKAYLADMRRLNLGRRFDGILAWDSFFHLACNDQRAMFSVFAQHATAGAALMFTSGPAAGETVSLHYGDELYHASLDPQEYRFLLAAAGFSVVYHVAEDQECGNRTVWAARFHGIRDAEQLV